MLALAFADRSDYDEVRRARPDSNLRVATLLLQVKPLHAMLTAHETARQKHSKGRFIPIMKYRA